MAAAAVPVSDFFQLVEGLDAIARIKIDTAFTTERFETGQVICREGDPGDSLYIVAGGVVEATTQSADHTQSRSVAYLRRGAFFGELGVLTGQPRMATISACQEVKLFRFEREKFLKLLRTVPEVGDYFTRILAQRLHAASSEAHQKIYELDLRGNLQRFDLLTIFQAITGMNHTGELKLHNSANEQIGSFFFREGRVVEARFVHLVGLEAVWQGFIQSTSDGTFTFHVRPEPTVPGDSDHAIGMESTGLLIEGISRRDVFQAIPEPMRHLAGRLSRTAEVLDWTDPGTAVAVLPIWELISKRPQLLSSMWRRLNFSALTFAQAVEALVGAGKAEVLPEPKLPAEKPPEEPPEAEKASEPL
jgi:CRP-like cAMP-binding protein